MIADSFNSFLDIFSSIMTFIGNKIASKPSDDCHNLGHGKAEYIFSMIISISMAYLSLKVFTNSFMSLFHKNVYHFSIWLIVVCIITIFVKFFLYLYTRKLSNKYHNLLIEANSKDHRNDCVVTLLTLISSILSINGFYFFDSLVGMIISIWIFITALKIFLESYDVLMDKSIDEKTKERVYELIRKHKEIKKIVHFNSTPVGYRYQLSFTIYVDGNLSTFESHEIADRLEDEIEENIPEIYLTIIHVNPVEVRKKKTIKSKHVGCYGVVYNENGQVLLIKKSRGAYKGKLDLPGGGIEYGEDAKDTLKREFLEEVGIKINSFKLRDIITHFELWKVNKNLYENLEHIAIIYDVKIDRKSFNQIKIDPDGLDSLGAQWFDIKELKEEDLSPLAKCIMRNTK